jgi:hypothetical protein
MDIAGYVLHRIGEAGQAFANGASGQTPVSQEVSKNFTMDGGKPIEDMIGKAIGGAAQSPMSGNAIGKGSMGGENTSGGPTGIGGAGADTGALSGFGSAGAGDVGSIASAAKDGAIVSKPTKVLVGEGGEPELVAKISDIRDLADAILAHRQKAMLRKRYRR